MEKCISMKSKDGITMISLIVTIIILLLLAGVTIAMLTNSGIIDKANDAAKLTNLAEIREQLGLDILDKQSKLMSGEEKRGELTQEELENIIEKYGELQDDGDTIVTEYGNISLKEIMSGNVTVADADTSEGGDKTGSDNNSQEVAELKQQIQNLEDKVVNLENKTNELENNTYYKPGDTFNFGNLYTGGFINSTGVYFSIPLSKEVSADVKSVTVSSVKIFLRQNGKFIYGTSSDYTRTSSIKYFCRITKRIYSNKL